MRRNIIAGLTSIFLCTGVYASGSTPLWLRKSSISPDGTQIAFSYQGDIFTVPSGGGTAVQITSNPAYDYDPIWMPDGKRIVFSSTREKSKDIFITSAGGGVPTRVTTYPGNETPLAVLDDGTILFSADIQQDAEYGGFPGDAQVYAVPETGGRPYRVTSLPVASLSVNKDMAVLYEDIKGYEDPFRKHHTSSVTRDIWLYTPGAPADGRFRIDGDGHFTKLTQFNGEDRNPVFAPDGDTYYYISEKDGSFNIYMGSISRPGTDSQITFLKDHPVRYISAADNGTLAFSYDGELYTVKAGEEPKKVDISIIKDSNEREESRITLTSGITSMAVSPNGKELAVIARGDVFVISID